MIEKHEIASNDDKFMLRTRNLFISKSEVKRMHYEELRELGILHEINRLFLHPLGLALAIMVPESDVDETGRANIKSDVDEENLVGLMYMIDDRDDPEGTIFAETALDQEKIDRFEAFRHTRWRERQEHLGFVIQPRDWKA